MTGGNARLHAGVAVGDPPRHRSALCPGQGRPPGRPRAGVCRVLVRVCGTRRRSSLPGPAPAAGAFGTLSRSHGVAGFRVHGELRAPLDTCVFTIAKQQQKSVAEVIQLLSVTHVGQMLGKFLSLLSPPPPLPSPSHFLSLNMSWLCVVEEVVQIHPFCCNSSPAGRRYLVALCVALPQRAPAELGSVAQTQRSWTFCQDAEKLC